MTDAIKTLAELFDNVPLDLGAYFKDISDGSFGGREELELNLLTVADAVRWTNDFRDFHPIIQVLGGMVLDDPNTSNHHVYLTTGPCAGTVLFLNHDGNSQIVFRTLASFLNAAQQAVDTIRRLRTFHPDNGVLLSDQSGLNQLVAALYDGQFDCDGLEVLLALVPSMDMSDLPLLQRLAVDDDFYVVEAIGDAIARRPRRELQAIAANCQQHPHPQAARAGSRAVAAIALL